ncbi:hypothetical protein AvCA_40800 [Azotobacter vinelandii CA]|uniref:Uncharacterized protein n=2 Tax=Azotobacter vinelandii TaxID=354 RepID=C1DEA7_AZOVD|nr:hypothetical protein Avin_40800 [Azotobacter vinelandii DJ]AGK14454.1 hypothetical protein AvCA_40800 [Azotobacter vinelandii CA]AGK21773.1 hypothetical protein AvCA6_40800 [Azotobacter vinelandii CA6]
MSPLILLTRRFIEGVVGRHGCADGFDRLRHCVRQGNTQES